MAFDPNTATISTPNFNPSTARPDPVDLKATVSNQYEDVIADKIAVERMKTMQYLSQKGYSVNEDNLDLYKEMLFPKDWVL